MASSARDKHDSEHIHVYVRIRPLLQEEVAAKTRNVTFSTTKSEIVVGSKKFALDGVFQDTSRQIEVFSKVVKPLLSSVIEGYNCTVFSYGPAASGKTYTIYGNENVPLCQSEESTFGIIPRSVSHLLKYAAESINLECILMVSYFEMQNEYLYDLLSPEENSIRMYDDPHKKGEIQFQGLSEVRVSDINEFYKLVSTVYKQKSATRDNGFGHRIFTLKLYRKNHSSTGDITISIGKLSLIDLASQEAHITNEKRLKEASSISQSLFVLRRVVNSIQAQNYVSYRDSKLTRLLQDSLGGKTKTAMIATVSPSYAGMEDAIQTLDFAQRVRQIINKPEANQKRTKPEMLKRLLDQIELLKQDLISTKNNKGVHVSNERYNQLSEESKQLTDKIEICAGLQNKVCELERMKNELTEVCNCTKNELKSIRKSLRESKDQIKQLMAERKINKDLIEKYDQAQSNLMEDRLVLINALQQWFVEHNQLRDKVDTFYDVTNNNKSRVKKLHKKCEQQHKNTIQSISKYTQHVSDVVQSAVESNSTMAKDNTSFSQKIRTFLVTSNSLLDKTFIDYKNEIEEAISSQKTYLLNEIQLGEIDKANVINVINSTASSLVKTHTNAKNDFDAIKNNIQKLVDLLDSQDKENEQMDTQFAKATREQFEDLAVNCNEENNNMRKEVKKLRLIIQQQKQDHLDYKEKLDKQLEATKAFATRNLMESEKEKASMQAKLNETVNEYNQFKQKFAEMNKFLATVFDENTNASENAQLAYNELAEQQNEHFGDFETLRLQMSELESNHNEWKDKLSKAYLSAVKNAEDIRAAEISKVQREKQELQDDIKKLYSALKLRDQHMYSLVDCIREKIVSFKTQMENKAAHSMETTHSECLAILELMRRNSVIVKNASQNYVSATSSGSTPARRPERTHLKTPKTVSKLCLGTIVLNESVMENDSLEAE